MSVTIQLTFTPIEPYFIGGEQNAGFGNEQQASYFIRSETAPSQTTLLGVIRYSILNKHQLLTPKFSCGTVIDHGLREKQNRLIGKKSFSFCSASDHSFGHIKNISPIFLEKAGVLYSRIPFNWQKKTLHKTNVYSYEVFKMVEYFSGIAEESFWLPENYQAKNGIPSGWLSLQQPIEFVDDTEVFFSKVQVGITKSKQERQDSGFFKKEYKGLKEGWKFICFVEIASKNDLPTTKIVRMGQNKSLFYMECAEAKMDWKERLAKIKLDDSYNGLIYYAIADCCPGCKAEELYDICDFAVTRVRSFRSLITRMDKPIRNYLNRLDKTDPVALLRSGSVFYVPKNKQVYFENSFESDYKQLGFNRLLREEKERGSIII